MTHEEAARDAAERSQATGLAHVATERGGTWTVVRTNLPAPPSRALEGTGAVQPPPEDPRPSLIRNVPPYGPS